MSPYYDLIMTSGYYDYDAIVEHLARFEQAHSVLEIGAGTGLILQRLTARRPDLELAGVDLTRAMLDIAAARLGAGAPIALHQQNVVTMVLPQLYDLAFSYGGVWYFVPEDGESGSCMISHLRDEQDNQQALERVAAHLPAGGRLLLGVQAPHRDYTREVTNGMQYSQTIVAIADGFRKHYVLSDGEVAVMEQTTDYRTYMFDDAIALLDKCGFEYHDRTGERAGKRAGEPAPLFLEFGRR